MEIPGIGCRWTAEMFLIFGLKRPDVLALGDAGLQRAAKMLYSIMTAIMIFLLLGIAPSANAGPKDPPVGKVGDIIKIITVDGRARLCQKPLCKQGQELLRIPTNTELKIEEVSRERMPMWDVLWYKITYKGKKGWVSEFDTDKAPKELRYRR